MRLWYRCCRYICWSIFTIFFRGRVFGRRNVPLQGGVLLVCNHQSFLDPVLATYGLNRECHYMARDSLFRNAFFRRLIESLNAFPIKRGTADLGAIRESMRRLKQGALLTAFPESTRTPDGRIQSMQAGAVLIARKAGVPIVPTMILGAFEAWPRKALLPHPAPIIVAYGPALYPEALMALSDQEAIEHVRREILLLVGRFRGHVNLRDRLSEHSGADGDAVEATAISRGSVPTAMAAV